MPVGVEIGTRVPVDTLGAEYHNTNVRQITECDDEYNYIFTLR